MAPFFHRLLYTTIPVDYHTTRIFLQQGKKVTAATFLRKDFQFASNQMFLLTECLEFLLILFRI